MLLITTMTPIAPVEYLQSLSGDELEAYLSSLPTTEELDREEELLALKNANPIDKFFYLLNKLEDLGLTDEEIRLLILRNLI